MISNKYCRNLLYCIFLVVNLTKAEKPLIHEEKVDLIHNLLRWMKGFDVLTEQRCFTLNFGYQQPFPFPQLWLGLDSTLPLNVGSLGNKALELETKVAEDYTKFYNHGEGPYYDYALIGAFSVIVKLRIIFGNLRFKL